ncbi:uncharacterized protein C16orf78 homolog isoform X1 [Ailuropoda melanoleuca]|uniref:uncharacterized protein C16orf78 homolog isoform X1 n=1 Tax=Ailuropoda melanoleuca TaxID=9646 RepID=UPI000947D948|nr:uncharacterized protein C16orf78 homolog isoform X1 [Ailuropoda melanoleuca]
MTENSEHLKDAMPIERKSTWRTAEDRRMSDLTRVLEWLKRRQGKKKQQKPKGIMTPETNGKEGKKTQSTLKQQKGNRQVAFTNQSLGQSAKKDRDPAAHGKLNHGDPKGRRLSMVPGSYTRDGPRKSELDINDAIALESTQRPLTYRRQSSLDPMLQEPPVFGGRKSTLLRDWVTSRMPEVSYERKLKSLMEKGAEPKVDLVRTLKPEEVLSCRYLRLSKNNIRTLLKLCKDAGLNVDIHPHMVEGEIDAKKVFASNPSVAL